MTKGNQRQPLIGAIDAGTNSVKFALFHSQHIKEVTECTAEVTPIVPEEGWFEEDPMEIIGAVYNCIRAVIDERGTG